MPVPLLSYFFTSLCLLHFVWPVSCRFPKLICASVHVGITVLLSLFVLWSWLKIEVKPMFCTVYYFIFVYDGAGCCIAMEAHHIHHLT